MTDERNPPSRRWKSNDNYDVHRGYAYKDAGGRWRSPDGTKWISKRSAVGINNVRRDILRAHDLQHAARAQGVTITRSEARVAVAQGRGLGRGESRRATIDYASEEYGLDLADLADDYYDGDTP